jgi:hypothetical protein
VEYRTRTIRGRKVRQPTAARFYYDTERGSFYAVPRRGLAGRKLDVRALLLSDSTFVRSNFTLPAGYDVRYRGQSIRWDIRAMPPARLRESVRTEYSDIVPVSTIVVGDDELAALAERYPGYEPWATWTRGKFPKLEQWLFLRRDARHWFWVKVGENKGSP